MDAVVKNIKTDDMGEKVHSSLNNPKGIDRKAVRKTIISLAIPSIIEFVLVTAIGIIDLMFIGKLGAVSTAAAGLAWQIIWFLNIFFSGINTGTAALVARYVGARERDKAELAGGQSLLLSLFFSAVTTGIIIYFSEKIFTLLGADREVTLLGARYLKILASTFVLQCMMICCYQIMKSAGDTKTPMIVTGIMVLINSVLAWAMIFGKLGFPAHGVLGSAEASALVMGFEALLVFYLMFSGKLRIKILPQQFTAFNWDIVKKILGIGAPSSLEHMFYSSSAAVVIWIIAKAGTEQIAAHNVLLRAESLSFMPGIGFSIAAGIAVGQALGEKNMEKARIAAWESMKMGIMLMGTMGALFFLFPRWFIGLFSNDPQVLAIGAGALLVVGIIQPVQATMFVLSGALKGAGDTKTSMIIAFCGLWFIRAPFAYLFGTMLGLGVIGVWGGGMCMDIAFRAYLYYKRFLGDKWVKIKV